MGCAGTAAYAVSPIGEVLCAPSDELARRLTQQYGETRLATGVRDPEQVMEVWTSKKSDDWTLVMTYASGTSCIVAMGEAFIMTPPSEDPA